MLGFLLLVINRLSSLVAPYANRFLIDDVIGKHEADLLIPLVVTMVVAGVIQGVTSSALIRLLSYTAHELIAELRQKVQRHIARLSIRYHDANKSGALASRIMSDVEGIRDLIGPGLVDFVGGLITALIALIVLLRINIIMTGLTAVFLILLVCILRLALTNIRPIGLKHNEINAEVTGRLIESLAGVRVVKGYGAEPREAAVFARGVNRLLDNSRRWISAVSVMSFSASTLMCLLSVLIIFVGTRQVFNNAMTLGELVTFMAFLAFLVAPVSQMVNIGAHLTQAVTGLERTRNVLRVQPEDHDPIRTVNLSTILGELIFDDVAFFYEVGAQVLHNVSFRAEPGTITALVGPSGSGKSTIISLIAAFHSPTAGAIYVDGVNLSTVRLNTYRTQLGIVLQEPFLFDGTIEDNVAFAKPNATKEQILAACRIARVDRFAETFESQYKTIIGERGVKLSAGQRQRVSIARAVLVDPRILILDEATSSLDSESEALIQEGLKYLMKGRTTFVIAHRLSTVRQADQILVIDGGRVIERGTHGYLLRLGGRYRDLYIRQYGIETK